MTDYNDDEPLSLEEPTLFSLSGVLRSLDDFDLSQKLQRILDNKPVSILENESGRVLFLLEDPLPDSNADADVFEFVSQRIQDYVRDALTLTLTSSQNDSDSACSAWLDASQATITRAEMEHEVFVSEQDAYELWTQDPERTSHLSLVPSPDGDWIQPNHHNIHNIHNTSSSPKPTPTPTPTSAQAKRDPTLFEKDNVARIHISELSLVDWNKPVVLVGVSEYDSNSLREIVSQQHLMDQYGDVVVRTGNRETLIENGFYHSEPKSLREALKIIATHNTDFTSESESESSQMIFTPTHELPEPFQMEIKNHTPSLFESLLEQPKYTLCLAHQGFGIGLHKHGPALFYLVQGRKKWYLSPPEQVDTMLKNQQPTHPGFYTSCLQTCILQKGECLFVPDQWYHEIFNLDDYTAGIQGLADRIIPKSI